MASNSAAGNIGDKSSVFLNADKNEKTHRSPNGNSRNTSDAAAKALAGLPTYSTLQTQTSEPSNAAAGNTPTAGNQQQGFGNHAGDGVAEAGKTVWEMVEGLWTLGSGAVKTSYDTGIVGMGLDTVRNQLGVKLSGLPSHKRGQERLNNAAESVKAVVKDPSILIQDYKDLSAEGRYGAMAGRAAVDLATLGVPVSKVSKLSKLNKKIPDTPETETPGTGTPNQKADLVYETENVDNGKISKEMDEELLKIEQEFSLKNRIPKGHDFKLDEIEQHPARTQNPPVEATMLKSTDDAATKSWSDYITFKQDPPVQVLKQPDGKKVVKPTENPDPSKPVLESSRYGSSCGPTCASMISIDRGVNIHPSTFDKLAHADASGGTTMKALSEALNDADIPSKMLPNQSIDDLAKGVKNGQSAIVAVNRYNAPDVPKGALPTGHAVVVDRVYSTKGNNGVEKWVEFRDPYYGEHITMDANHFASFMRWGHVVYTGQ